MPFPWIVNRIRNVIHEECSRTQQLNNNASTSTKLRVGDDDFQLQGSPSPPSSSSPPLHAAALIFGNSPFLISSTGQRSRPSHSPPTYSSSKHRDRQDSSSSGGESPLTGGGGEALASHIRHLSISNPDLEKLQISSSPPRAVVDQLQPTTNIGACIAPTAVTAVAAAAASHHRWDNNQNQIELNSTHTASKLYGFGRVPESMIMNKSALKTIEQSFAKNKTGLGK